MSAIEKRITRVEKCLDSEGAERAGYSLEQLLGMAQGLTEEEVGPPARALKDGQVGLEELLLKTVTGVPAKLDIPQALNDRRIEGLPPLIA